LYAIAFDLDTHDTERSHPKGVAQAYADIRSTLTRFGFEWRQGSVYLTANEDLANLYMAITALKILP
jgi:virulence-associated protein VapD